jgi:hypothetical protein
MYTYAEVERALAAVHDVPPSAMGAFRGRIKHFQRLGLVPSSPGKGRKISYRLEDVYMWAVCLEFEEFGIDPVIIKSLHRLTNFNGLVSVLCGTAVTIVDDEACFGKSKNYFIFYPNFLSQWHGNTLWNASGTFVDDLSEITRGSDPVSDRLKRRMAAINLTWLRAAVRNELPV